MPTSFPGALDALPRPGATTEMDDPGFEGDVVIDNISDAIEAVEAKLGIGASTPGTANRVLRTATAGSSSWGQVVDADISSSAAISPSKILAGTNRYSIQTTSGVAGWAMPPMYPTAEAARNAGTVALTQNNWTAITFDTEVIDQDNGINIGGNPSRITFTTAGMYLLFAMCEFAGAAGSVRGLRITINGVANAGVVMVPPAASSFTTILTCWGVFQAAAAQYVEMYGYTDAASSTTSAANNSVRLRAFRFQAP